MRVGWAAHLTTVLVIACYTPAHADQAWTNADVICSRSSEVAVVRFGMSWNGDPPTYAQLPPSLDSGLSQRPSSKIHTCRLPSGRVIHVRIFSPTPQARGLGGGDPPSYFNLKIGARQVRTKVQWKPQSFGSAPWISGIIVSVKQLTICTRPKDDAETTCGSAEPQ